VLDEKDKPSGEGRDNESLDLTNHVWKMEKGGGKGKPKGGRGK